MKSIVPGARYVPSLQITAIQPNALRVSPSDGYSILWLFIFMQEKSQLLVRNCSQTV